MLYAEFDKNIDFKLNSNIIGFYNDDLNAEIPENVKQITVDEYTYLLGNYRISSINPESLEIEGLPSNPMGDNLPAQTIEDVRHVRNQKINTVEWKVFRHRAEKELGSPTTLSQDRYMELLTYIQKLRDVPQFYRVGENIDWPVLID